MSFAKNAADELLGDDAEAGRQINHKRLKNLLMSLGVLGAGVGGAYYLGKNNGQHWNELTGGLDQKKPVSGVDKLLSKIPFNKADPEGNANLNAIGLGATAGGVTGLAKAPTIEGAHTLSGMANNAVKGPLAEHMQAMGGAPTKDISPNPSDPVTEINKSMEPITTPDANEASVIARIRAAHTGKLTQSTPDRGLLGKPQSLWDKVTFEKGLERAAQMAPGTMHPLPSGQIIDMDKAKADLRNAGMGVTPGATLSAFRGASRVGSPNMWSRGISGGIGALLGGYLGDKLTRATTPAIQTK